MLAQIGYQSRIRPFMVIANSHIHIVHACLNKPVHYIKITILGPNPTSYDGHCRTKCGVSIHILYKTNETFNKTNQRGIKNKWDFQQTNQSGINTTYFTSGRQLWVDRNILYNSRSVLRCFISFWQQASLERFYSWNLISNPDHHYYRGKL